MPEPPTYSKMITKKLKNFEYAALDASIKESNQINNSKVTTFDTPNGYVLLSVVASGNPDDDISTSSIVCERIKYYLDNEILDNAEESVFNALGYTNGYVFELKRKNKLPVDAKASVAFVLVKNLKVYFGWMGDASFLLFNGKRAYSMGWPLVDVQEQTAGDEMDSQAICYLGARQISKPAVCEQPLVPVDGDILVAGAGKAWEAIKPKVLNGILADSMPLPTKVQRLMGIASENSTEELSALQAITFYNLINADQPIIGEPTEQKNEIQTQNRVKDVKEPLNPPIDKKPLKRKIIVAACLLAVAYMFYDLFLRDPVGVAFAPTTEVTTEVNQAEASKPQVVAPDINSHKAKPTQSSERPTLPVDVNYTVKNGDIWSNIYLEFEVCSWFIKNHPPNTGKFDREGNPVAGKTIAIPVKYSAKQSLNPNYYTEFSLEKLGRTCQNANTELREAFEKKVKR